ncbi:hypothetical protein P782_0359 [Enterococcus faecalis FL2]|uniref:hypothetical protein n=1 Tax=Enterococcus TaxID=1350 RepID=UPI00045A4085|nr:hypothetical protein [Enterococcus faecalis]EHS2295469.1 hypothetical protein [Enterococcus faecalis]KAJ66400.1 hypothetical protein P782_0359 [Enterococcus faecalis FL2]
MIRFRNPASDMNIIIRVFKKLYLEFSNVDYFDLDNIAEFFAREQLASSSGYIGDEALKRSYSIPDDSRKSMKMQAKSYSEVYRFLGWITSEKQALQFSFTFLGVHMAVAGEASKLLFEQCLLGISYPNHVLNVKFPDVNKPFVNMLIFSEQLDGKINRDEILLGPMNLSNGYDQEEISSKIKLINDLRSTGNIHKLNEKIKELSDENSMATNSVRNLTRFPLSALKFTGWFTEKKLKIYGTSKPFLVLTDKGKSVIEEIKHSWNVNGLNLEIDCPSVQEISELGFLFMLNRASFNIENSLDGHKKFLGEVHRKYNKQAILFSPFQYFNKSEIEELFPELNNDTKNGIRKSEINHYSLRSDNDINSGVLIESESSNSEQNSSIASTLSKRLEKAGGDEVTAILAFINDIKSMRQTEFYPLVASLLSYIFDRQAFPPPAGNNNMRYDVMIPDSHYSIPVEVKSPTEEEMLSVKAIRQALENKILLLARKPYNTEFNISSFAIGFNLPNKRSDIYKLIDEIYNMYKINIAILDMSILIKAAFYCLKNNSHYEVENFKNVRGVIKFES